MPDPAGVPPAPPGPSAWRCRRRCAGGAACRPTRLLHAAGAQLLGGAIGANRREQRFLLGIERLLVCRAKPAPHQVRLVSGPSINALSHLNRTASTTRPECLCRHEGLRGAAIGDGRGRRPRDQVLRRVALLLRLVGPHEVWARGAAGQRGCPGKDSYAASEKSRRLCEGNSAITHRYYSDRLGDIDCSVAEIADDLPPQCRRTSALGHSS